MELSPGLKNKMDECAATFSLLTSLEQPGQSTHEREVIVPRLKRRMEELIRDPEVKKYMEEYIKDNDGPSPRLWVPKHMGGLQW